MALDLVPQRHLFSGFISPARGIGTKYPNIFKMVSPLEDLIFGGGITRNLFSLLCNV